MIKIKDFDGINLDANVQLAFKENITGENKANIGALFFRMSDEGDNLFAGGRYMELPKGIINRMEWDKFLRNLIFEVMINYLRNNSTETKEFIKMLYWDIEDEN